MNLDGPKGLGLVLFVCAVLGLAFGLGAVWGGVQHANAWSDAGCVCP